MKTKEIQKLIDEYAYWDMRVTKLECDYFADEITLVYDDTEEYEVVYKFHKCYKVIFDHVKAYDKLMPAKEMSISQIPYFMQDVQVTDILEGDIQFHICKIDMFPLDVEIWSKEIEITRKKRQLDGVL